MPAATIPSIFDLLTPKSVDSSQMVSEGDCGIIVKLNGEHEVFTTGVNSLRTDPSTWGERELAQIKIGRKLLALSVALRSEEIMNLLYDIADGVLEPTAVTDVRKH